MPFERKTLVAVVASSFCAITSCTSTGATSAASDSVLTLSRMPTPRGVSQLSLPFDAYDLSREEGTRIQIARRALLRDCMKSFGLDFSSKKLPVPKYAAHVTILGWLGSRDVERYGYRGAPGAADEMAAASARGRRPIVVPAPQVPVYNGSVQEAGGKKVPPGGCRGETERLLNNGAPDIKSDYAKSVPIDRILEAYEDSANDFARSNKLYAVTLRAWSACMRKSGYEYSDTNQSEGDRRWTSALPDGETTITPLEISTASTDLKCRLAVNYSGVLQGLISYYEKKLLGEKPDLFEKLKQLNEIRLRNASRVLAKTAE